MAIRTNANQISHDKIGEFYPDVIITPINSNTVQFIIEVETIESVNAFEATSQWKPYSTLGGTFYLLVPTAARVLTESICRQYGIQAKFGTYWLDESGRLNIDYEA